MSIFIGVDPGKSGAFAMIATTARGNAYGYAVYPWDDAKFVEWCREFDTVKRDRIVAVVEKVGAMPGQGVTSMFNFGKGAGFIEGVLQACKIPYQLVPPATWKREFSLVGKDKAASIEACKRLFPGVNLLPTEKSRKDNDGMAEALLLAEYARRKM